MFTASTEQRLCERVDKHAPLKCLTASTLAWAAEHGCACCFSARSLARESGNRRRRKEGNRRARFLALEIVAGSMFATDKRILFTSHSLAHLSERIATNKASLQQPI